MTKSSKVSTLDWESYDGEGLVRTSYMKKKGKHKRAKASGDTKRFCRRS